MIVNPGIRRFLGSAIQRLFNSASFYAPLTHTLALERGTGSPTFTRATTATVEDNEGVLRTAIAGEARFEGARRVRNLISTTSEDFSNAAWTKINTTVVVNQAVAPNGTTTAALVYPTTTGALRYVWQNPAVSNVVVGTKWMQSFYVKSAGKSWVCLGLPGGGVNEGAYFNISTGTVGTVKAGAVNPTITDVGNGWWRCSLNNTDTDGLSAYPLINVVDGDNSLNVTTSGTDGVYIWGAQLEDITGRTDQTTPSEYVSVGVESAPYYHGSMVDGVKCFPTDLAGNPLTTMLGYLAEGAATNLCLQSQTLQTAPWAVSAGANPISVNSSVAPDGTTTADLLYEKSDAVAKNVAQPITITTAAHTWSVYAKENGRSFLAIDAYDGSQHLSYFDLVNGTTGTNAAGNTSSIESVGDGWYRCSVTRTAAGTGGYMQLYLAEVDNSISYTGDGSSGIYLWGAQVELGAFASSYIATTTAAVTRNADVLTYSGGDIPNLKTLSATFKRESGVSSVGVIAALSNGTINEYAAPTMQSATNMRFEGVDGGVLQWATSASNAYAAGATSKVVQSTATNDIKMAKDGVGQSADTTATLPTIDRLDVGHLTGSYQLSGNVGPIYGWTRNLSQSETNAVAT